MQVSAARFVFRRKPCLVLKGIQVRQWWSYWQELRSSFRGFLSKWPLHSTMRDAVMYPPVTWQSVPVLAGLHHQYSGYDFRKGQQVN